MIACVTTVTVFLKLREAMVKGLYYKCPILGVITQSKVSPMQSSTITSGKFIISFLQEKVLPLTIVHVQL